MNTSNTTIEIFDPPMCCPSGFCGPSIDPALLEINEAILKVKKEYNGKVTVARYSLSQQGAKFVQHAELFELLKLHGVSILPVTVVNGKIVKQQAYPSYEQLTTLIGV